MHLMIEEVLVPFFLRSGSATISLDTGPQPSIAETKYGIIGFFKSENIVDFSFLWTALSNVFDLSYQLSLIFSNSMSS
jgi:hypothetical protein